MPQRTPLYDTHVRAGARLVEFAGWEMPVQYAGVLAEHEAVRTRVGLFDVSHMGEVIFRGPRALEALTRAFTNDLSKIADGQAQYGCLCRERGRSSGARSWRRARRRRSSRAASARATRSGSRWPTGCMARTWTTRRRRSKPVSPGW